jgi:hypothetical protein
MLRRRRRAHQPAPSRSAGRRHAPTTVTAGVAQCRQRNASDGVVEHRDPPTRHGRRRWLPTRLLVTTASRSLLRIWPRSPTAGANGADTCSGPQVALANGIGAGAGKHALRLLRSQSQTLWSQSQTLRSQGQTLTAFATRTRLGHRRLQHPRRRLHNRALGCPPRH